MRLRPPSRPAHTRAHALTTGLAFSESERDRLYLRGLLPPAVLSQEVQLERAILNIRSKDNPLDKYTYLSSLQGRNERLFYRCVRSGACGCVRGARRAWLCALQAGGGFAGVHGIRAAAVVGASGRQHAARTHGPTHHHTPQHHATHPPPRPQGADGAL
jgi:hypothetical protein